MHHIDQLLANQGRSTTTTPAGGTSSSVNRETLKLVNEVFDRLKSIYPAWKQALPTDKAEGLVKKEWLGGLMDAGIADWGVIQAGVDACRGSGSPFWPSVGQFIALCNKAACERMGALDVTEAFNHLMRFYAKPAQGRDVCQLNPFVYHTISDQAFDTFRFKVEMNSDQAAKYFEKHYQSTLKYLTGGGDIRKPVDKSMRIENPSGTTHGAESNKEAARKNLDAMKAMLKPSSQRKYP